VGDCLSHLYDRITRVHFFAHATNRSDPLSLPLLFHCPAPILQQPQLTAPTPVVISSRYIRFNTESLLESNNLRSRPTFDLTTSRSRTHFPQSNFIPSRIQPQLNLICQSGLGRRANTCEGSEDHKRAGKNTIFEGAPHFAEQLRLLCCHFRFSDSSFRCISPY
jgi:hypothetical protein